MQQHRASFTSSRFSRPSAEDATTVYSYEPAAAPADNGAYDAYAHPAYQYAEAEYVDTAYVAADESPTVVTTFATTADATPVARRGGAHRIPLPPTALKGRAAVLAVAAGAVVAAGQAVVNDDAPTAVATSEYALAAGEAPAAAAVAATTAPQTTEVEADSSSATPSEAPQILSIAAPVDLSQFNDLLAKGQRFSEERAAREAAARRPLFALPAQGTYTSNFGTRWGVLHAGVDVANAIGTPIYAVADGKVIDSGPAAGFGMWVRVQHADGTITVYGHIDTSTVTVGQDVMAGDQIATMGNRGFSTGPHLHFEVHLPGEVKIDPLPWLASRGISLGPEMD
ncbi:M23 family metallopeptidase [Rhodococcus sp. IEGM 1401]|uniref:M23 family metallopeptidase n=1 Tax=unclassified Rhodococcus (in: high G+C Gram-positive bacteria) TaxID=192944 RepID=UPI0022B3FB68|nr:MULTISPECIES: M23 family metallopeptidase [unclassified Rhodococcus (in: high G+C Gram-positive bacteria)]MCZ4560951.1 M23 family metallopeptidase [Rhodococcus sp. IEGM 1401]MDI9921143.1 M23 family metallopeptidase [Rhodococcus sp. IEGM 1372]MDV8033596.1 M23 family metallopeptidase [Rhodococcus sp. IEGM 1414]